MDLMDAIYTRRSIRKYRDEKVSKEIINQLIDVAIKAPSAMNSQPWAFAVIQDVQLLKKYSDGAKSHLLSLMEQVPAIQGYKATLSNPDFNIFYNAGTLVLVYATQEGVYATGDCCFAAQNIMLAAHDQGLGTCWIGFAREFLNLPDSKRELGIPENYTLVAPLILGYPDVAPAPTPRKPAQILAWK